MRRVSRLYDPLVGSATGRLSTPTPSRYVCRTCLRQRTTTQLPPSQPSAPFSTSTRQSAWADKLKGFSGAMKGETSMFDKKEATKDEAYEPAETWDGLEWVGTKQWYEDRRRPEQAFEGYGRITAPMKERLDVRDALLKTVVEMFALKKANPEEWRSFAGNTGLARGDQFPHGIRVGSDATTGKPIFEFENADDEAAVLNHFQSQAGSQEGVAAHEARAVEGDQAARLPRKADFAFADLSDPTQGKWSSIRLDNLKVRFAIAKRVQLRTGIRLTDPQITQAKTVGAMFIHLWKPEKPKKLAEGLLLNEELRSLPNVKIADHRVTFVHKEREVGRWKVIEDELNERGIPPLGRPDRNTRSA